jgi:hypothetical protein
MAINRRGTIMPLSRVKTKTTTIRLPIPVYEQIKRVVETSKKDPGDAICFNDLVVAAIKAYLKMYRRLRRADAAFAGMAEDADYQNEAAVLAGDFEYSDWEALEFEERALF